MRPSSSPTSAEMNNISTLHPSPVKRRKGNRSAFPSHRRRGGIVALWVILITPALMLMLFFVSDIGKIWIARIELENALEAAALAGVKTWGEAGGGPTATARAVSVEYASVNTVDGLSLVITSNLNAANPPNENASTTGNLVFGSATQSGPNWIFDPGTAPSCGSRSYAIRAQSTAPVTSFCNGFLGLPFGPYEVEVETTAIYQCVANTPRIVASP
jgi:Flp pilus assembly protein TadG